MNYTILSSLSSNRSIFQSLRPYTNVDKEDRDNFEANNGSLEPDPV